eukprot:365255-Chlamydomonas_euryale.AAC.17
MGGGAMSTPSAMAAGTARQFVSPGWDVGDSIKVTRMITVTDRQLHVSDDGDPASAYTLSRKWVQNDPELEMQTVPEAATIALPPLPRSEPVVEEPAPICEERSEKYEAEVRHREKSLVGVPYSVRCLISTVMACTCQRTCVSVCLNGVQKALHDLKEHWVAVRHHHQAMTRKKALRHRARLAALLEKNGMLQQHQHQSLKQQQQLQQPAEADVAAGLAAVMPQMFPQGGTEAQPNARGAKTRPDDLAQTTSDMQT